MSVKTIPESEDGLKEVATRLFPYDTLEGQFDVNESSISIIIRIPTKRKIIPVLPHKVSTLAFLT